MALDRPIIVSGGSQMFTVQLPPAPATEKVGEETFTVTPQPEEGEFKTIEFFNDETKELAFTSTTKEPWTITIK